MLDEVNEFPVYTEMLGLVSAKVYEYDGVYSLFLEGDKVVCFLGNCNSLDRCQEEIKTLGRLAKHLPSSGLPTSVA